MENLYILIFVLDFKFCIKNYFNPSVLNHTKQRNLSPKIFENALKLLDCFSLAILIKWGRDVLKLI